MIPYFKASGNSEPTINLFYFGACNLACSLPLGACTLPTPRVLWTILAFKMKPTYSNLAQTALLTVWPGMVVPPCKHKHFGSRGRQPGSHSKFQESQSCVVKPCLKEQSRTEAFAVSLVVPIYLRDLEIYLFRNILSLFCPAEDRCLAYPHYLEPIRTSCHQLD